MSINMFKGTIKSKFGDASSKTVSVPEGNSTLIQTYLCLFLNGVHIYNRFSLYISG